MNAMLLNFANDCATTARTLLNALAPQLTAHLPPPPMPVDEMHFYGNVPRHLEVVRKPAWAGVTRTIVYADSGDVAVEILNDEGDWVAAWSTAMPDRVAPPPRHAAPPAPPPPPAPESIPATGGPMGRFGFVK